jgi:hypothetical protein
VAGPATAPPGQLGAGAQALTHVADETSADIVVHYVPNAGGAVFAGYAICGVNGCPNILVRRGRSGLS